nr:PREDICTED: zona pellucida sperm-binding protein 1-like [Lepisosteus oculatus]
MTIPSPVTGVRQSAQGEFLRVRQQRPTRGHARGRLLLVYLLFVSSPRVFVFLMRGAMARRRAWLLLLPCFVCVLLRLCPAAGRGLPVSPAPGGPSPAGQRGCPLSLPLPLWLAVVSGAVLSPSPSLAGCGQWSAGLSPLPLCPAAGCEIPSEQQVRCGLPDTSPAACQARGCCVDNTTSGCYYPLNVCTRDGHFIFTVHRHDTVPDTDPRGLVAGPSGCAPALATPHYAIFAIGLQLCGVRSSVEGNATVYAVEVRGTRLATAQVAYGQISRDVPFSMQVRCRLVPGSFSSRGFLVRDLPPPVASAAGQLRLELRVARDGCYRSYFPQAALPLQLRLKAPLFLEVRLVLPPDPSLVLLVHYCVAYPRSAQAAWVLIYDGCPNEVDPDSVDIKVQPADHPRHYRRFTVHTFQFVNPNTGRYLGEEVYIMCVTEVCSPAVQSCDPKCFDPKTMRMQLPGSKPVPGDIAVQQGPFLMPKAWPPK